MIKWKNFKKAYFSVSYWIICNFSMLRSHQLPKFFPFMRSGAKFMDLIWILRPPKKIASETFMGLARLPWYHFSLIILAFWPDFKPPAFCDNTFYIACQFFIKNMYKVFDEYAFLRKKINKKPTTHYHYIIKAFNFKICIYLPKILLNAWMTFEKIFIIWTRLILFT